MADASPPNELVARAAARKSKARAFAMKVLSMRERGPARVIAPMTWPAPKKGTDIPAVSVSRSPTEA